LPGGRRSPGPRASFSPAQEVVSIRRSLMSIPGYLAKFLRGGRNQVPVREPMRSRLSLGSPEGHTLLTLGFAPAVTLPGGVGPPSTRTADLNADGKQDVVVLNQGSPFGWASCVSVLLNPSTAGAAVTTTTLQTSTATAVSGQGVLLTATVNSAAGTPTSTVTF